MIKIRPSAERGASRLAWLDSRHTFSFADYHDPAHMGFRTLRVLNDDRIAPSGGFATHGHRDMEIVTYVIQGTVAHRDNLGHVEQVRAGELQRMTAGTGIRHSEFNPSDTEPLRLLQIWVLPEASGLRPGYEQREFGAPGERDGRLHLAVSRDGRDGSLRIHQDVDFHVARLEAGASVEHPLAPGRAAWLQIAGGAIDLSGTPLADGDGAAIEAERTLKVTARAPSNLLLIDLA
ncbi:MAG: pirin family protein [Myxococcales bacterium]|nr:pirin family protein [Myxococcales bacterium]